jgi:hypothetical protein
LFFQILSRHFGASRCRGLRRAYRAIFIRRWRGSALIERRPRLLFICGCIGFAPRLRASAVKFLLGATMIFPREQIYSALFSVLQGALLSPAGPFKTVSRRWQDPTQISPADRPALYQVQKDELATTAVNGLPLNWRTTVDLVLYTSGDSDPTAVPSIELNSLLDATEAAIRNAIPGLAQSLGNRVSHCRIQGKIEIVENVQGAMAMAVVPVEILTSA